MAPKPGSAKADPTTKAKTTDAKAAKADKTKAKKSSSPKFTCDICCDKVSRVCAGLCDGLECREKNICKPCLSAYILVHGADRLEHPCMFCKETIENYKFYRHCTYREMVLISGNISNTIVASFNTILARETERAFFDYHTDISDIKWNVLETYLYDKRFTIKQREEVMRKLTNNEVEAVIVDAPTPATTKAKTETIRCPKGACIGIIDVSLALCPLCSIKVCIQCREEKKDNNHKCDPDTLKSIRMIKKDSVPCPQCHSMTHRIYGCDEMFCSQCKVSWSYSRGVVQTGVHNPDYVLWLQSLPEDQRPPPPPEQQQQRDPCLGLRDFLARFQVYANLLPNLNLANQTWCNYVIGTLDDELRFQQTALADREETFLLLRHNYIKRVYKELGFSIRQIKSEESKKLEKLVAAVDDMPGLIAASTEFINERRPNPTPDPKVTKESLRNTIRTEIRREEAYKELIKVLEFARMGVTSLMESFFYTVKCQCTNGDSDCIGTFCNAEVDHFEEWVKWDGIIHDFVTDTILPAFKEITSRHKLAKGETIIAKIKFCLRPAALNLDDYASARRLVSLVRKDGMILGDENFVDLLNKLNGRYHPTPFKQELFKLAVSQNGLALKYTFGTDGRRPSDNVVRLALRQNPMAIHDLKVPNPMLLIDYMTPGTRLSLLRLNGKIFEFFNIQARSRWINIVTAVAYGGDLKFVSRPWTGGPLNGLEAFDQELALRAVLNNGLALEFYHPWCLSMADDRIRAVVRTAVTENPHALEYAGTFCSDREIVLIAVRQDPEAIRYASPCMRDDPQVLEALGRHHEKK